MLLKYQLKQILLLNNNHIISYKFLDIFFNSANIVGELEMQF